MGISRLIDSRRRNLSVFASTATKLEYRNNIRRK